MLFLLSPAKRLDMSEAPTPAPTAPRFAAEAEGLVRSLRTKSAAEIGGLMSLSDDLAKLNRERFRAFGGQTKRPALLAFAGDVYRGLDARSLDQKGIARAQESLRILSGLYGLLRPLDAIEPYRLEMGTKLRTRGAGDLYAFWGDRIGQAIQDDLARHDEPVVVNLASNEYAKAALPHLEARVVTPVFREVKDGQARTLALFAKVARGAMARWAVDEGIETAKALRGFDRDGYRYDEGASTDDRLVFSRPQPPRKT